MFECVWLCVECDVIVMCEWDIVCVDVMVECVIECVEVLKEFVWVLEVSEWGERVDA